MTNIDELRKAVVEAAELEARVKYDTAKEELEEVARHKEQCAVSKREFARMPGKEYELGLGDVTFFGLAE